MRTCDNELVKENAHCTYILSYIYCAQTNIRNLLETEQHGYMRSLTYNSLYVQRLTAYLILQAPNAGTTIALL